jgi:inner membrane protein
MSDSGMDNVTHGLAGLLLADLTVAAVERRTGRPASRGFTRAAVLVGIVAAELPDGDLVYSGGLLGMGKLGYLLHHRGHTHTVLVAVLLALALWGVAVLLRRKTQAPGEPGALLALALTGTLSHLLLDFTNSYGVHPFWPVQNTWHYGDAVFIVEPWLWVVAIPALLFGARRPFGRGVLTLALGGILAAAWLVSLVPADVAAVLTVAAAVLLLAAWRATRTQRLWLAVAGWLVVEVIGFAASGSARALVASETGEATLRDVVLSPAPANPLCLSAIVVEVDAGVYRVSTATVAAWPALRDAARCAGGADALAAARRPQGGLRGGLATSAREPSPSVAWERSWHAPVAELERLSAERCDVAAALEFMRVPVWEIDPSGDVTISDFRFGFGGDGFADVALPASPVPCPRWVPGWTPPRADVLSGLVGD